MTDSLQQFISQHRVHFEHQLEQRFANYAATQSVPQTLLAALRYSSLNGGKRIRAMLVYMAAKACGGDHCNNDNVIDSAAMAVELMHCYSLVHDDLPAMDDDALRRGKPSCHIQFNEATAILAGDALQALAFEWLAEAEADQKLRLALLRCLACAGGGAGMVGGQALDLAAVNQQLSYEQLTSMHRLKTGALIEAAVYMGCLCAAADNEQCNALRNYAGHIGLAFQVQDDILDIEGCEQQTGKPRGTDVAANKPTYPALLGITEAKRQAAELCQQAVKALEDFDNRAEPLRQLARYIVNRSS